MNTTTKAKEVKIIATVHRADGTQEYLGTISYWHSNPLRRLAHRIGRWVR